MGSSSNGSPATDMAGADVGSESSEPGQRGFLGRIFSVFSGADASGDAAAEAGSTVSALPVSSPSHGMANLRKLRVDDVALPKAEIVAVPVDIGRDALVDRKSVV